MEIFDECVASGLSRPNGHFIYRLVPNGRPDQEAQQHHFAAISSDDALTFFRVMSQNGTILVDQTLENVNKGIACLESLDASRRLLATSGSDGAIHLFDGTSQHLRRTFRTPKKEAVSTIASSTAAEFLVVGTDLQSNGPGEVTIYLWRVESSENAPVHAFRDWHTDTITSLAFHPVEQHLIFSASTDGLITYFDLRNTQEEAEPLTIINTSCAVKLVLPIFAPCTMDETASSTIAYLTHDERMSFNAMTQTDDESDDRMPSELWDFRKTLGVDYAVTLRSSETQDSRVLLVTGKANGAIVN